jgi:hypothetical protein
MPLKPGYEPSPSEIFAACREIQKSWSESERESRSGIDKLGRWLPPGVERKCRISSASQGIAEP